jgi:hypothetical protein
MAGSTLSNAQSLRVIGQDLDALGINAFHLGKRNSDYTLWVEEAKSGQQPSKQKPLFNKITQAILARSDSSSEASRPIHLSSAEILWAHVAQGIKRKASDGVTDHNLSLLLRVLGDHLDQRAADDFIIFWSTDWVKVVYGNKEENFTLRNLHEVDANMHLKRTARSDN